jgi:hypothetical protein
MKCPKCGKNSIHTRSRVRKYDGAYTKYDICFAKGCGYTLNHTPNVVSVSELKKEAKAKAESSQLEFNFN